MANIIIKLIVWENIRIFYFDHLFRFVHNCYIWGEVKYGLPTKEVEIKKIKINIGDTDTNTNANQPLTEENKGIIIKIHHQFRIIAKILILLLPRLTLVLRVQAQAQAHFAHQLNEDTKHPIINVKKEKNLITDIE